MPEQVGRPDDPGALVVRSCAADAATVVQRCRAELDRRGIAVFAVFDHGAAARAAGLELAPEVVVVFGDPQVGTRLMQVDPTIGIELPLRLLVWTQDGATQVGFADPVAWAARYAVPADHPVLTGMWHLLDELAEQVTALG